MSHSSVDSELSLSLMMPAWDRLAEMSSSPMQDYIWAKACIDTLNAGNRLYLVPPDEGIGVSALAPLVKQSVRFVPRLTLPGSVDLGEPMDLLYADGVALSQVARRLVEIGLPLYLPRLPVTSLAFQAISEAYKGRGLVVCRPEQSSPTLQIQRDWAAPEFCLNPGRRSDLRRMRRNAEKLGAVEFEIHEGPPQAVRQLLDKALSVELKSWKGRSGTALMLDEERRAFFTAYAIEASKKGVLRVFFLKIGGQLVAMQIAVESGKALWLFKIGYDEDFKKCAPGQLLMLEAVRYAMNRKLSSIEFLGRVEPWTQVWTQDSRQCLSLRTYPKNSMGALALAVDTASWSLRQVQDFLKGQ